MSADPEKFFIGLVDFFSVMLPGALLTFLLMVSLKGEAFMGLNPCDLEGAAGWVAFLFCSYLLGHFVFLIGALLDEWVYEKISKGTEAHQIERLARGEQRSPFLVRLLARAIDRRGDRALHQVERIKDQYLASSGSWKDINAFQWCKARLALEHPDALEIVQRSEADSKFFRSLIVVLAIAPFLALGWEIRGTERKQLTLVCAGLMILAFWRYVHLRAKATSHASWLIITLEAAGKGAHKEGPPPRSSVSHGGGVVFRNRPGKIKYLLVEARRAPGEWVLPKGHIEAGEKVREAAVREVREESGVWARYVDELGVTEYSTKDAVIKVQNFLMKAVSGGKASEGRRQVWLPLAEAVKRASHEETRELLRAADERRQSLANETLSSRESS